MSRCTSCGYENPPVARFCSQCAAPIQEIASPAREERKVVTVVFADLVGFTARAEQLDPEDVRAMLSPYYARLRIELERHGGTVEKFIGDAVMALFGAPTAHEDDPERAVRAALAIRDWVLDQEGLQVRIAVNTGEVLVTLGARTAEGEGMASGDVVNTTARLQSAAPVNGILVGEVTHRATSPVITYVEAEPVTAKGKSGPVRAWVAVEARSHFGRDLAQTRSQMIGREHELAVLKMSLARALRDRTAQLVTVVGVPGIGKTRLTAELFRHINEDPEEVIIWRQGRSLPYGDGVTFWALAEMVKAQAGILETDSANAVEQKLSAAASAVIPDNREAQWVGSHLYPLAGIAVSATAGGDLQGEAFTAWRRFLEAIAEQHPLTLVFEDLHWADDQLLEFIEHLADWSSGVPILVLCTARPELFERRAGWGGGKRNAVTVSLSPLSEEEAARLISSLTERPVMHADTQQTLLARCGGNPLYAEQFVRMLAERGTAEDMPLPETVQGIIAARLDALSPEEKTLLQNASVIGKVFWLGAVSRLGGIDRSAAEQALHALERKEFVQRARRSSVADEAEFSFLHVLVRDVSYGQLPRAQRAEKHQMAAAWIASLGRTDDQAETLAHHYLSALQLLRAAGHLIDPDLEERALLCTRDAGDRAFSLNALASAVNLYESALAMAPTDSSEHAELLFKLGRARIIAGDTDTAMLATAYDELLAHGDRQTAAEAAVSLAEVSWLRGDRDAMLSYTERAHEQSVELTASTRTAFLASSMSRFLMLAGKNAEAIRFGHEALAMAEKLELDELRAHALNNVGSARVHSGDRGGLDDLEASVALAERANAQGELCRSLFNLGVMLWEEGELRRGVAIVEQMTELAARIGHVWRWRFSRGQLPELRYELGHWDAALQGADEFIAEVEAGSPHVLAPLCHAIRAQIRTARDDPRGALRDVERALEIARLGRNSQILLVVYARAAEVLRECGEPARAGVVIDEFLVAARNGEDLNWSVETIGIAARTLTALGRGRDLAEVVPDTDSTWLRAGRAVGDDDMALAADIYAAMGAVAEEARNRLGLAEELVRQNRRADADTQLHRALAFYRSVGATRYIREGEALLAASA